MGSLSSHTVARVLDCGITVARVLDCGITDARVLDCGITVARVCSAAASKNSTKKYQIYL